ncbi:nesprin-4 isoform X1 [Balaenoptera acutorostrata]|uniref:Nesprin-4 isoform X1 n=1 Tax=Balaenoptera acutorostrata TaxID=9767 RepID=A0ABM3SHM5_BALAC|nr:nesprin-4 isoform X1 [Balaenoptera acutorostrata]
MALPPCLGPTPPSEPFSHPPGAPRELNASGCTICSASGEERIRSEQAQKLGQDSLDPPEPFQGGPRGTESAAGLPRLPTPPSHEDSAGAKHRERPISGREVLEAEQDSLHLCLLGLGLRLQDLEQGLGPWASAQSRMVQLQALQADLHGAAERLDALLVFGEGLAQRSEPQARASLEQVLRAFRAHRDSIFRQLWRLQAQLVSYSLVFEEASTLEQDLEAEGDSDGTGPGGVWGPWAPSSLPTPAELEWDPAGDVGGLGPLGQRTTWTPGTPCELCGRRGPQGRGQSLEVRAGGVTSPQAPKGPSVCLLAGPFFPFEVFMALSLPVSLLLLVSQWSPPSVPLPLLASRCLCCTYISSFPLTLSLTHLTTATLASWLFKYSKYTPISKPSEAHRAHILTSFHPVSPQMLPLQRGLPWPPNIITPYPLTLFPNSTYHILT